MAKFTINEESVSRARTQLKHNYSPSRKSGLPAWVPVIFGLPFLIAGTYFFLAGLGIIEVDPDLFLAPPWVISIIGFAFMVAGVGLMASGINQLKKQKTEKRERRGEPQTPWERDFPEGSSGLREKRGQEVFQNLFFSLIFFGILAPFNWWAFFSGDSNILLVIFIGLFDLIAAAVVYQFFYRMKQYFKFGNSYLEFKRFPFFLGDIVSVNIKGLPRNLQTKELELFLYFIEEVEETFENEEGETTKKVAYQLYEDKRSLPASDLNENGKLSIDWELPKENSWETDLSEVLVRYWELYVKAEIPGVNYEARFHLPVYSKNL